MWYMTFVLFVVLGSHLKLDLTIGLDRLGVHIYFSLTCDRPRHRAGTLES